MSQTIKFPKAVFIPISKLKPNPRNVKLHSRGQILGLCEIIKTDGYLYPISIDENFTIWKGHARFEAALELGVKKVPVTKELFGKSEDEKYESMIADNKINESAWNQPNLKLLLRDVYLGK